MSARAGWVAVLCLVGVTAPVRAQQPSTGEAVALLPLDTDRNLEIYGQPVARAIARALEDGKIQVVVVGAKATVPERARLIVDGTLAKDRSGAVTIALRIRSTADGKVLGGLSATAPALAKLDVTAADLSARLLPLVRDKLAALRMRPDASRAPSDASRTPDASRAPPQLENIAVPVQFVGLTVVDAKRSASSATLLGALDGAATAWARAHKRDPRKIDANKFDARLAAPTVVASGLHLGIVMWIVDYTPESTAIPMARARVQVRVADDDSILFDRVVVTDTVLGDKGSSSSVLAARVAREVLAILEPHFRRRLPSWR